MSDETTVAVVAAVLEKDGAFLVGRRPLDKRHGGLWEFPGGKLRPGESMLDAARRELLEEVGLEVLRLGDTLHVARDPGSPFEVHFVEVDGPGRPVALEHSELRWVNARDLADLALAPCDEGFVQTHLLRSDSAPQVPERVAPRGSGPGSSCASESWSSSLPRTPAKDP